MDREEFREKITIITVSMGWYHIGNNTTLDKLLEEFHEVLKQTPTYQDKMWALDMLFEALKE